MEQVNNAPQENAPQETPAQPQAFDYEKVASILDGKMRATEESVLKGYAKQQGLTGDEMAQAIEAFKREKASRAPNIDALNGQITDLEDALLEAQSDALYAQANMVAMRMASELGVESSMIPFLMKVADLSDVVDEGEIDREALMESLSAVLDEIPQLRTSPQSEKSTGFRIGADKRQIPSTNDELATIFGVFKK